MALFHVVLFSFRAGVTENTRRHVITRIASLADDCGGEAAGILYWRVGLNQDLRKGIHLVEISIFKDDDALQKFRAHRKHLEVGAIMTEIADWVVGDMDTDIPLSFFSSD